MAAERRSKLQAARLSQFSHITHIIHHLPLTYLALLSHL